MKPNITTSHYVFSKAPPVQQGRFIVQAVLLQRRVSRRRMASTRLTRLCHMRGGMSVWPRDCRGRWESKGLTYIGTTHACETWATSVHVCPVQAPICGWRWEPFRHAAEARLVCGRCPVYTCTRGVIYPMRAHASEHTQRNIAACRGTIGGTTYQTKGCFGYSGHTPIHGSVGY